MKTTLKILCTLSLAAGLSACLYKPDLHQGNRLTKDQLGKIEMGMSREQVAALLGTPLVNDPFHVNRWDYYRFSKTDNRRDVTTTSFSMVFVDNRLSKIINHSQPAN